MRPATMSWCGDAQGYLVAIGMCGQGFMLGPGLGELLSRMVRVGPDGAAELSAEDREVLSILSPARAFAGQEALK